MMKYLLTSFFVMGSLFVLAQAGTLDPSYGDQGIYSDSTPYIFEVAFRGAIQPDDKILIGGYCQISGQEYNWLIRRIDTMGTIDTTFGNQGDVRINFNNSNGYVTNIHLLPSGKILLIGYVPDIPGGYALARLNPDGSLDNTFGNGGIVLDSLGVDAILGSLVIAPNGDIYACGSADTNTSTTEYQFFVASFKPNGQRNSSFGTDGRLLFSLGYFLETLQDISLQPDGKILVAGEGTLLASYTDAMVFRLNPNGSLDNSFGTNGYFLNSSPPFDQRTGPLLLLGNGNIIAAGTEFVDYDPGRLSLSCN